MPQPSPTRDMDTVHALLHLPQQCHKHGYDNGEKDGGLFRRHALQLFEPVEHDPDLTGECRSRVITRCLRQADEPTVWEDVVAARVPVRPEVRSRSSGGLERRTKSDRGASFDRNREYGSTRGRRVEDVRARPHRMEI